MRGISRNVLAMASAGLVVLVTAAVGEAQTYRFRLQPSCNTVTLTLLPSSLPSVVGVVGYDDNCGEDPRSPIHGTAVMNRNGGFSIGYTTSLAVSVYERTDVGLQTNVEWPADSNVGYWYDDDGDSGTFVFDILDQPSG